MRLTLLFILVAFTSAAATVSAHNVTYRGTVVSFQVSKFAQPGGGTREVQELEATVQDLKTKKPLKKVFTITEKTKITRDGKSVTAATAAIQKDERVEVVVDHDKAGDEAITVRVVSR